MARILLGVSGGIAAYKALELVRLATAAGHAVRVVQTPASRRFVGEASFAALTGRAGAASASSSATRRAAPSRASRCRTHEPLSHLQLVANADVYLIAPASANTIAKLAGGHRRQPAHEPARWRPRCPLVVAPAMNNRMYEHPATQANLRALARAGRVRRRSPASGRLASAGEHGVGRLAEPAALLAACESALAAPRSGPGGERSWAGVRVLVTRRRHARADRQRALHRQQLLGAHGPRARRARRASAGAQVTLVAANVALDAPAGVTRRGRRQRRRARSAPASGSSPTATCC